MSRPRTRRAVAALTLAALLASATPAWAADFGPGGLPLPGFWVRAWSWLTDWWVGDRPEAVVTTGAAAKGLPLPSPKPPKPKPPGGVTQGRGGEHGGGVDPDG